MLLGAGLAHAGWGDEDWGTLVWGGPPPAVPFFSPWIQGFMAALLLVSGVAFLRGRRRASAGLLGAALALPFVASAAQIGVPFVFSNGSVADATEVNANFDALVNESNDQDLRIGSNTSQLVVVNGLVVDVGALLERVTQLEQNLVTTCVQGETRSCGTGVGVCSFGTQSCNAGGSWDLCTGGVMPSTETCGNGLDEDCDGQVDEGQVWLEDFDEDTYGVEVEQCTSPPITALVGGDCDDTDATIFPGATEIPNDGIDQDCDGSDLIVFTLLSQTGLYSDIATKTLAPGVQSYSPIHPLWVDGGIQDRFVLLPMGATIDNGVEDDWSLPVGAVLWKEISLGGLRVETQMIHRTGVGPSDFEFVTFEWNAGETDADVVSGGSTNVRGTTHDILPVAVCGECHRTATGVAPSIALGFSALQLSHAGPGVTYDSLQAASQLTVGGPAGGYPVPGNGTQSSALGYLHANCSSCHNATPGGLAFPSMDLRVSTGDATVGATGTYNTAVDVSNQQYMGTTHRVLTGDPGASAIFERTNSRVPGVQMPTLGSEVVDTAGVNTILSWILSP